MPVGCWLERRLGGGPKEWPLELEDEEEVSRVADSDSLTQEAGVFALLCRHLTARGDWAQGTSFTCFCTEKAAHAIHCQAEGVTPSKV